MKNTVATSKSKFAFFFVAKLHIFVPCYMTKPHTSFGVVRSYFAIITYSKYSLKDTVRQTHFKRYIQNLLPP